MAGAGGLKIQLRVKIRLENGTIGPGKIALLEQIACEGSISAAGRTMNIPFRRAWHLIETMNQALGRPVVRTMQGGRSGGGAVLTPFGREVIALYRSVQGQTDALSPAVGQALRKALNIPDL